MNIYIMTRGRVGTQHTWNALPDSLKEKTFVVCPDNEIEDHYHNSNIGLSSLISSPNWVKNYSDKFKWLLEMDDGNNKGVIIDDDLRFSTPYVRHDGAHRLCTIGPNDSKKPIEEGFQYMDDLLESTALVSFHPRQMGHTKEPPYVENGKIVCIQGFNRSLIGDIPDLNRFPILADVVLNCTLLSRGISNKIITTLFIDWYPCQAPGGCSLTRTPEIQAEACYWLEERFGPYIKAVIKEPKNEWLGGKRVDFRGQWKKLYAAGVAGILDLREGNCTPIKRTR